MTTLTPVSAEQNPSAEIAECVQTYPHQVEMCIRRLVQRQTQLTNIHRLVKQVTQYAVTYAHGADGTTTKN